MTKRTIIFHVGQPKTGSSALQAFLSTNVKQLKANGISYPFPEGSDTIASGYCSGNLMHTMQSIAKSKEDGNVLGNLKVRDLFERHLSDAINRGLAESRMPTVLFSSEAFTTPVDEFSLPPFAKLNKEYDIKIICFVRDPYDFTISAWKQGVKTGRCSDDFELFVNSRVSSNFIGLDRVAKLVSTMPNVRLINYDVHKKDVFTPFLRAVGLNGDLNNFKVPLKSQSNPSLSYSQAATIVQARKIVHSPLFTALLTKRYRSESEGEKDPYFSELDELILDFLKEDLEKLNRFLPDREKLRKIKRSDPALSNDALSLETLQSVLEVINEIAELKVKRRKTPRHKSLPRDFDPLAYLLMNPDLEAAGVDPIQHYLNNGRFEARRYK